MTRMRIMGICAAVAAGIAAGCGDSSATKSINVCSAWETWCVDNAIWVCLSDGVQTQWLHECSSSELCLDGACIPLVLPKADAASADDGGNALAQFKDVPTIADTLIRVDTTPVTTDAGIADVQDPADWGWVKPKDIAPEEPFPTDIYPVPPPLWVEMWNDDKYFDVPWSMISLHDDRLAIAFKHHNVVRIFDVTGKFLESWGWPEATGGFQPQWLAQDEDGVVWVSEGPAKRVVRFLPSGEFLGLWSTPDTDVGSNPDWNFGGIAVEKGGSVLFTDPDQGVVVRFSATGQFMNIVAEAGEGPGQLPSTLRGLRVAPDGRIFVSSHPKVVVLSPEGTILGQFQAPPEEKPIFVINGIFFDYGYIYVAGGEWGRIYLLDEVFNVLSIWGHGNGTDANKYRGAYDVTVGVDGRIFVADAWNRRIQVYQWASPLP